ncbi:CBS domain-containing protein [Actinokineospora globicatena]|uniref:CBS domain-containing protein n=1 Tax=Actinokineospora globicatena TaxID=103729 RepID=A0A9W6QHY0_9PSEU|nr:CBS domain-containing protein [Actinokineospora globicatena]GLW90045.1 hypothetical protein Aglo03_08610 [Actinokineospora globicatena]
MLIAEIMDTGVPSAQPDTPLDAVLALARSTHHGVVPVLADNHLVGIITTADLLREQVRPIPRATTAADAMHPSPTIRTTTTCGDAARQLLGTGHGTLPVVTDRGSLAGTIDVRDVLLALEPPDALLAARVGKLVADHTHTATVDCTVTNGLAILTGDFTDPGQERVTAALATSIPGIRAARTQPVGNRQGEPTRLFGRRR